jgi:release factor glutamine methyltransferase
MELLWFERSELIIHYDDRLDDTEILSKIKQLYDEYAIGKQPLEYILWYVEYGWLRFHVNKNTIIPRPETEYMIEAVREFFLTPIPSPWQEEGWPQDTLKKYTLVDVGTGSGVLWLSILHSHASQIASAFLIDISEGALEVARHNYDHLLTQWQIDPSIEVVIEKGNLFEIQNSKFKIQNDKEIVILANLPYIPDETFDTNPDQSIKFEPRVAFVGWDDGLDLYRIMFEQIRESGCQFTMFLEMMTWQVDILRQEFDWLLFEEIKTFHFQIRIVKVVLL